MLWLRKDLLTTLYHGYLRRFQTQPFPNRDFKAAPIDQRQKQYPAQQPLAPRVQHRLCAGDCAVENGLHWPHFFATASMVQENVVPPLVSGDQLPTPRLKQVQRMVQPVRPPWIAFIVLLLQVLSEPVLAQLCSALTCTCALLLLALYTRPRASSSSTSWRSDMSSSVWSGKPG